MILNKPQANGPNLRSGPARAALLLLKATRAGRPSCTDEQQLLFFQKTMNSVSRAGKIDRN
jgi:hypothetical protein